VCGGWWVGGWVGGERYEAKRGRKEQRVPLRHAFM
jgi:hypothetical protein